MKIRKDPAGMVREFHRTFNLPLDTDPDTDLRNMRVSLIVEEALEAVEEINRYDLPGIAKELADLVYVAYGAAVTFGIDLDEAIHQVHGSNMSKLGDDGKPIYRPDGKVLKGPNYREADVTPALPE